MNVLSKWNYIITNEGELGACFISFASEYVWKNSGKNYLSFFEVLYLLSSLSLFLDMNS